MSGARAGPPRATLGDRVGQGLRTSPIGCATARLLTDGRAGHLRRPLRPARGHRPADRGHGQSPSATPASPREGARASGRIRGAPPSARRRHRRSSGPRTASAPTSASASPAPIWTRRCGRTRRATSARRRDGQNAAARLRAPRERLSRTRRQQQRVRGGEQRQTGKGRPRRRSRPLHFSPNLSISLRCSPAPAPDRPEAARSPLRASTSGPRRACWRSSAGCAGRSPCPPGSGGRR